MIRWRAQHLSLTLPGAWMALVFACLSFTPSLLPRPALFQGLVTGINAAIGYGLGVLGAWIWREFADRPARQPAPRSWRVFTVTAAVALLLALLLGRLWHRQTSKLVDIEPEHPLRVLLVPVGHRPRSAGTTKYGIWNRLWVGIGDLLALWWLIRRRRDPGSVGEVTAPPAGKAAPARAISQPHLSDH